MKQTEKHRKKENKNVQDKESIVYRGGVSVWGGGHGGHDIPTPRNGALGPPTIPTGTKRPRPLSSIMTH